MINKKSIWTKCGQILNLPFKNSILPVLPDPLKNPASASSLLNHRHPQNRIPPPARQKAASYRKSGDRAHLVTSPSRKPQRLEIKGRRKEPLFRFFRRAGGGRRSEAGGRQLQETQATVPAKSHLFKTKHKKQTAVCSF